MGFVANFTRFPAM